jgi:hypothetical protein
VPPPREPHCVLRSGRSLARCALPATARRTGPARAPRGVPRNHERAGSSLRRRRVPAPRPGPTSRPRNRRRCGIRQTVRRSGGPRTPSFCPDLVQGRPSPSTSSSRRARPPARCSRPRSGRSRWSWQTAWVATYG